MIQEFINSDCMKYLKDYPDNYFDLAIVDPPYFSGPEKRKFYGRKTSPIGVQRVYKETDTWELPTKEYFDELFRVSKHQIIWGVNYFSKIYNFGPGRIVWDKVNGKSSFSDCEIAYCSLHDSVRKVTYMWNGMFQGEKRIHPTQKPVNLYRWMVDKYCRPEFKILDTHVGSASSLIAFREANLNYVGFEINTEDLEKAKERIGGRVWTINSNY